MIPDIVIPASRGGPKKRGKETKVLTGKPASTFSNVLDITEATTRLPLLSHVDSFFPEPRPFI